MKTKSGLNLSIPLGAIVWGMESVLGSALLFLMATLGSILAGIWAGDGLFALGVCCLLIGYRMGKEIEGDADLLNRRLVLILIPLGVLYSLRWLPMVLSHRKRLSEDDSSEIIFD